MTISKQKKAALRKAVKEYGSELIDLLLDEEFLTHRDLRYNERFVRRSDDDDGLGNTVSVFLSEGGSRSGGDAFVDSYTSPDSFSLGHCFRAGFFGGASPRVRAAYVMLARAIQRENADRPIRVPEREYNLQLISNALLARLLVRQLWQVQDSAGESYGRSMASRLTEAITELMPLPPHDWDQFSREELLKECADRVSQRTQVFLNERGPDI